MSKIIEIVREDNNVVMTVELSSGHREKWTYQREKTMFGYNYLMIDKQQQI